MFEIELHGFEQQIYIVFERTGDQLTPFKDDRKKVLKYPSITAAKSAFSKAGIESFEFVHATAYGEMIGNPGGYQETEMRQRIRVD